MTRHLFRGSVAVAGMLAMSAAYPFASAVLARDHGVMGQTWGIAEPDLLTTINNKLQAMQANGGIARMQANLAARTEERVRNPLPVSGLEPTRESRSWNFDPSIVVAQDIRDQKGNLVAAAGTHVNPLSYVTMKADLVFIDGRDEAQVDWAVKRWSASAAKIIFVAGSPFEKMGEKKRRFFFDQQGSLVQHFGIVHVPAIVAPAGQMLKVSEVEVPGMQS